MLCVTYYNLPLYCRSVHGVEPTAVRSVLLPTMPCAATGSAAVTARWAASEHRATVTASFVSVDHILYTFFTLFSLSFSLWLAVTVRVERGDVPRCRQRLWHSRNLRGRLQSGKRGSDTSVKYSGICVILKIIFCLLQCPHNVHKLNGYMCDAGQVKSGQLPNMCCLLFLLNSVQHFSFCMSSLHRHVLLLLLLRAAVTEVAVRPEMASAGLCGATVGLEWI